MGISTRTIALMAGLALAGAGAGVVCHSGYRIVTPAMQGEGGP